MDLSNFSPALVLVTVVALALAPFVAVMVTSFTKIVVVLSLLRNALGLQQVPPNVVINGLAIVLSIYVMYPVILDTTAAVNGLPPVTTSVSGSGGPQTRTGAPAATPASNPAAPAAQPPGASPAAPAAQPGAPPAANANAPMPTTTRSPNDPVPTSPAAADARAAEAAAQAAAGVNAPSFAGVTGSPGANPAVPAQNRAATGAQTPNATPHTPGAETSAGTNAPQPIAGSTASRTTVIVPAQTRISDLSLTQGQRLDTQRLLAMFDAGKEPLRKFLIQHSSDAERAFFLRSARRLLPPASRGEIQVDDFIVVIPAFTVSELTAAFQIGFLIFLPFLIIDLVVSNILLALGMMMMSPTTVSLPFKLLLFVLIDGWAKLVHGLVLTYGV